MPAVLEAAGGDRGRARPARPVRPGGRPGGDAGHAYRTQTVDGASLLESWRAEASWLGWGPEELDRLLTEAPHERAELGGARGLVLVRRTGRSGLTETDGIFTRHQVSQAVVALLPPDHNRARSMR